MLIAVVMLAIYLAYDLAFTKITLSMGSNAVADEGVAQKEVAADIKDYAYYSNMIAGKQIFAVAANAQEGALAETAVLDDAARNLTLVGIVAGQKMQAVIENKKTEKTSTLNRGDSLEGFTVLEILSNKVILDQNGKKVTLSL